MSKDKTILRTIRDEMPESIKFILRPAIRSMLVNNPNYQNTFKELKERQNLSKGEVGEKQFIKLKQILIHAFENVPYYGKVFKRSGFNPYEFSHFSQMKILPYLDKHLVRKNFKDLISKQIPKSGYYRATTGGTSGYPLSVLLDRDSIFKEHAFINFFRARLGYESKNKIVSLRGIEFNGRFSRLNPMDNALVLSPFMLSNNTAREYVKKINRYRPEYLHGYPTSVLFLARLMEDQNLKLERQIGGIFLISESVSTKNRRFIEKVFSAETHSFYGQSERTVIADEKTINHYEFDPYYGFAETIAAGKDQFEIVGTGFLNYTMPLIRYKTGDICRKTAQGYILLTGRWETDNYLVGKNGEKIYSAAINLHSESMKNVLNYQFVQNKKGNAKMIVVPGNKFSEKDKHRILHELGQKIGKAINLKIELGKVGMTGRGKTKMIINKIA
jgi:phenylacetate-CoA ligase